MEENIMLLVDDIEINRGVLAECFCREFTILHAEGGHRAIELIEEYGEKLSIILLDIVMPDMDGIAVLRWLKASPIDRYPS